MGELSNLVKGSDTRTLGFGLWAFRPLDFRADKSVFQEYCK